MTPWEDIVGESCTNCGKPASHFWSTDPICCQCHGGNVFSAEETAAIHERILQKRESENENPAD